MVDKLADLQKHYPDQKRFQQCVGNLLNDIDGFLDDNKEFKEDMIVDRLIEPDRTIKFRITWQDEDGSIRNNRGWRVQHNNSIGSYKGGLRFHPIVNEDTFKFLAFDQTFKNALTGLQIGGAKGGSDFNPHAYSQEDVLRFCHAYMTELYRHIGPEVDIPAGDIGVGEREIGYLFGAYKKITGRFDGAMTGKNPAFGGSCIRKEATGYGCAYFIEEALKYAGESLEGKKCLLSGAGNVALYTAEMLLEKGARVASFSDSKGMVHFPETITQDRLSELIKIKEREHGTLEDMCQDFDDCKYHDAHKPWGLAQSNDIDIAIPAATENELEEGDARILCDHGVSWICEAANMPLTYEARDVAEEKGVTVLPSKAVNAGGVSVSGMERTQNAQYLGWSPEKVCRHLHEIMKDIHDLCTEYGTENGEVNYSKGANIAGFHRVANAMRAYGTL